MQVPFNICSDGFTHCSRSLSFATVICLAQFETLPESFLGVAWLVQVSGAVVKQGYMPAPLLEFQWYSKLTKCRAVSVSETALDDNAYNHAYRAFWKSVVIRRL